MRYLSCFSELSFLRMQKKETTTLQKKEATTSLHAVNKPPSFDYFLATSKTYTSVNTGPF